MRHAGIFKPPKEAQHYFGLNLTQFLCVSSSASSFSVKGYIKLNFFIDLFLSIM